MSEQIKDGDSAFPVKEVTAQTGAIFSGSYGMSLRDWFAGQAIAGAATEVNIPAPALAKYAYELADLMLKERSCT